MFTKKRKENYPVNIRRIVTEIIAIIHSKTIFFLFIKRRLILHYYLVIIIMFIIYLSVPIEWPITETRLTTLIEVTYRDEEKDRCLLHINE